MSIFARGASTGAVLGEAVFLGPALIRPGPEVQRAATDASPVHEAVRLGLPAAPSHASASADASAAAGRLHLHPPAEGRRALLGHAPSQRVQPQHQHVRLPEAPASQGVHSQPGLGRLASLRHLGAAAATPPAAKVTATFFFLNIIYSTPFSWLRHSFLAFQCGFAASISAAQCGSDADLLCCFLLLSPHPPQWLSTQPIPPG